MNRPISGKSQKRHCDHSRLAFADEGHRHSRQGQIGVDVSRNCDLPAALTRQEFPITQSDQLISTGVDGRLWVVKPFVSIACDISWFS